MGQFNTLITKLRALFIGVLLLSSSLDGLMAEVVNDTNALKLIDTGFFLQLPKAENVFFRGMVSNENAGGKGASPMMYPAAGVAGFLAAIATHGILVEASKNGEKAKQQELADRVLDPYKETIAGFTNMELMQLGLGQLSGNGAKSVIPASSEVSEGWIIESTPTFTMTQDQSALILENAVTVYSAQARNEIKFQNIVRVISNPRTAIEPGAEPQPQSENKLKQESVSLFAHSLKIILQEVALESKTGTEAQKTFRYLEGNAEKIERGQFIAVHCNRAIIKTLRGWLMSIPLRPSVDAEAPPLSCSASNQYDIS